MNIYHIYLEEYDFDFAYSFVVVANTIKEARSLAKDRSCAEGREIWDTAKYNKVGEYTGKNKKPFIVQRATMDG